MQQTEIGNFKFDKIVIAKKFLLAGKIGDKNKITDIDKIEIIFKFSYENNCISFDSCFILLHRV